MAFLARELDALCSQAVAEKLFSHYGDARELVVKSNRYPDPFDLTPKILEVSVSKPHTACSGRQATM